LITYTVIGIYSVPVQALKAMNSSSRKEVELV